jgi:hypothetical protein
MGEMRWRGQKVAQLDVKKKYFFSQPKTLTACLRILWQFLATETVPTAF